MKFNKSVSVIFPLSLCLGLLASCNNGIKFTAKTVAVYPAKLEGALEAKLYFSNSLPGIPYIDLNDGTDFLKELYGTAPKVEISGSTFKYSRDNGSYVTFYLGDNIVESNNLNRFQKMSYALSSFDERGNDTFIKVKQSSLGHDEIYEVAPKTTYINLDLYNIKTYKQGNNFLVPFSTFYNITGLPTITAAFNGESVFLSGREISQHGDAYMNKYYSFEKQARSKELIEYNYNEFIRHLDYMYGLSAEHGITSFDKYFEDNGIKKLLLSDSRKDEDKAYYMLQNTYLADSHTGLGTQNAYGGKDDNELAEIIKEIPINPALYQRWMKSSTISANRSAYNNGKKCPPILEANGGETLILTFDSFTPAACNYYSADFKDKKKAYAEAGDTISMISYANDLIQEDVANGTNKIKNVVIDLTNNGGGSADAAIFTLSWLDSAFMQLVDPISSAYGSATYTCDINFDGKIDANDKLVFEDIKDVPAKHYQGKVYCLTSETSFSCGNYVPAMLKQSGLAKLVGTKSGGGACIVNVCGTPDGTIMSLSGNKKLCTVRNGSYYSIDQGVDPDYYLDNFEILYGGNQGSETASNRINLVDYLHALK